MLIPLLLLALDAAPQAAPQAAPPDSAAVEVVDFRPEGRTLDPGGVAVSELVLRNRAGAALRVWVGYSVQDPAGRWFDVPARALDLPPGEAPRAQRMEWPVPAGAGGSFRVVMAVWTAPPGEEGARRLASRDRAGAFRVEGEGARLAAGWSPGSHALGRGVLRPEAVLARGEGFRLRLLPGGCDGAEVRSDARVHFGEYTARLRTPDAPGSLSAFFLYEGVPGRNDEIDVEILNDGSRRALLTAWRDGRQVRQAEATLPFDPAAAHHDYTIRWGERELVLLADGAPLARWRSGYPRRPMHLMLNAWWPAWLPCRPPATPRELDVEWIR